jgi:hypothetical protein
MTCLTTARGKEQADVSDDDSDYCVEDDSSALPDILLDNDSYFTCNDSNNTYCSDKIGSDWEGDDSEVLHDYCIESLRF